MISYEGVRVLVTGASGFLGSHASRHLVQRGADVHALVRSSGAVDALDGLPLTTHVGDVTDYQSVLDCFKKSSPRIVFHLAGDTSARRSQGGWDAVMRSFDVNLVGTINVIRAADELRPHVETVLRLGGLEEYGLAEVPYQETAREQPVSPYSASQVAATHFCQAIQLELEFQIVTMRPALVYGPGQRAGFFIPALIRSCLAGIDFDMTAGTQARDLLYIDDAIEGILLAGAREDLRGAIINLSTGVEHSMARVSEMIGELTGAKAQIRRGGPSVQINDLEHLYASNALAKRLLGWSPRISLEEGLSRTIAALRSP